MIELFHVEERRDNSDELSMGIREDLTEEVMFE